MGVEGRVDSGLVVRSKVYARLAQPYLVVSHRDTMNLLNKTTRKYEKHKF
jgi:hypothetical protein